MPFCEPYFRALQQLWKRAVTVRGTNREHGDVSRHARCPCVPLCVRFRDRTWRIFAKQPARVTRVRPTERNYQFRDRIFVLIKTYLSGRGKVSSASIAKEIPFAGTATLDSIARDVAPFSRSKDASNEPSVTLSLLRFIFRGFPCCSHVAGKSAGKRFW